MAKVSLVVEQPQATKKTNNIYTAFFILFKDTDKYFLMPCSYYDFNIKRPV
jgi:hypothetical protein